MTARLLRLAHRNVVRPLLRTKHDVVRSALGVVPGTRRARSSSSDASRPGGAPIATAQAASGSTEASAASKRVAPASGKNSKAATSTSTKKTLAAAPKKASAAAPKKASTTPGKASPTTKRTATTKPSKTTPKKPASSADARTKAELYEEATRRDIAGRSTMTKAQLLKALGSA